ncbi:MAG: hypothetical protein KC643_20290 [Nitrospira sp.]|nr:hypothetical protein [Nitrospira sp.]MCA9499912.1 hypothetical protein [Nitrospira sp.]
MDTPTNELNRLIIACGSFHWSDPCYMALTLHAGPTTPILQFLGEPSLDFPQPYQIFGTLCHGRAQQVVDHRLLVQQKPITPERYLQLWRHAFNYPLTPHDLADRHGYRILAHFQGPEPIPPTWKNQYTRSPFATFTDFI